MPPKNRIFRDFYRGLSALAGALALTALAPSNAWARDEIRGHTPSGASYVFAAPEGWRPGDALVFVNHGFAFDIDDVPDLGPLADLQLSQGYALAASGYRQRGWALFTALDDNAELLEVFRARFGEPGALYAVGGSMGGLISLKQAEDPRFAAKTVGVYALCPPAMGSRSWDYAFDLRVTYDRICDGVGGGELQHGDEPLRYAINLDDIPADLSDLALNGATVRALARITQCTGLFIPPGFRTPPQRDRLETLREVSGITSEDFLALNLAYAVFGLSDLVRASDKLGARNPFDNRGIVYRDTNFDARVARYAADPFAALDLRASSDLRGAGQARIVALTTSRDQLVVPQHLDYLRTRYPSSRLSAGFVTETEVTHCGFNDAELKAGWNSLRAWVGGGAQPSVPDLAERCQFEARQGATGPCRIDANANPARPVRLRDRDWRVARGVSGAWFDPSRDGEGLIIENLPGAGDAALVSAYTYQAEGVPGPDPLWIVGLAERYANTLRLRDAYVASGSRFDGSGSLSLQRWGRFDLSVDANADGASSGLAGRWRFAGPDGFGTGERALRRVTVFGAETAPTLPAPTPNVPIDPADPPLPVVTARSGSYELQGRPAQGLVLQQVARANGGVVSYLTWYSFDAEGRPMWMLGVSEGASLSFDLIATRGARFLTLDPARVIREPWGRITLEASACALTAVTWQANDPRLGSGRALLSRLSDPVRASGTNCR